MNKEIKFRAWTGEKMTDAIRLESAHGIRLISSSDLTPHQMSDDKVVFMQYTGLKDKNGKEIYEGDIVKSLGYISEVKFKHGAFIIGYHGGSSTATRPQLIQNNAIDKANRVEVIGNVFENPELLISN